MKALRLALAASLITMSMLVAVTTSRADTLPDYYPKSFAIIGVLDELDTRSQTLVIDDRSKRYDINIKVRTQNSQFSSLSVLRPGMTVGASLSGKHITEIWVLPKGYKPSSR